MAARILEDHLVLDETEDIVAVSTETFPVVRDFEIRLRDTGALGVHLDFVSTSGGRLAGFPWWDHADADLRGMSADEVPMGTVDQPFCDLEQGWQIVIWERDGQVHIIQGRDPVAPRYHAWFSVPKDVYLSAWLGAIARVRSGGGAFKLLEEALEQPDKVRALELGNRGLLELSPEIGVFQSLESLNLYLNRLTYLPPEIGKLKQLRWIDLRFNRVEALPDELALLDSLESINLCDNRLQAIPSWVAAMPKLKTFYVPGNPIDKASMAWIRRVRPDLDVGALG